MITYYALRYSHRYDIVAFGGRGAYTRHVICIVERLGPQRSHLHVVLYAVVAFPCRRGGVPMPASSYPPVSTVGSPATGAACCTAHMNGHSPPATTLILHATGSRNNAECKDGKGAKGFSNNNVDPAAAGTIGDEHGRPSPARSLPRAPPWPPPAFARALGERCP
jgi:hypothetical protein